MKDDLNKAELMLKGYTENNQDNERVLQQQENQVTDDISSNSSNPGFSDQQNFSLPQSSFCQNLKADSPTTPTFKQRRNTNVGIPRNMGQEFFSTPVEDDKVSQRS